MRRFLTGMLAAALLFSTAAIDLRAAEESVVSTLAGIGSHGSSDGERAQFNLPRSILASSDGMYVTDTFNNLIRFIDLNGDTSTVAGNILGLDAHRFPIGHYRDGVLGAAMFNRPKDMIMGTNGNIFVLDSENHALRIIMQGKVFTFAGNGQPGHNDGLASQARFNRPSAIAVGTDGDIYIADSGNHVIRKIDTNGNVATVAGQAGNYGHNDGAANEALFNSPMGIAVDGDGRIFVADTGNHLIRVIYNGKVTTLAGALTFPDEIDFQVTYHVDEWDDVPLGGYADGKHDEAMFNMPQGLAIWQDDILIVADTGNHRIRAILPDGNVLTLAGNGYPGHDDGVPDEATFHLPEGISVFGNTLYIADTGNNVIRAINLTQSLLDID